ncbi:MAG TPA: LysM peptidoglycan-binding domain-containing protein [Chloroflexia bacterium]|jgi:LysM repeat protein|nr:LysM peptidoglycan-binding domain-containing protein [Chloroflexia bacterium]
MKRLSIHLLAVVLSVLLLLPGAALAAGRTHTVQYGETMTSIAAQYGVSVSALAAANGIGSPNLIYVGQTLTIPGTGGGSAAPAPAASGGAYVVQPGDNLSTIAMDYGLSVDALAAANGLSNTNFIWAGQRLTIPGKAAPAPAPAAPAAPAPAQASGSSYTVRAGDNLSTIAAQYGVSVDALAQANGITNRNLLFSGQVLAIPGKAAPAPKPADSAPQPPKAAPTAKPVGANPTPTIAPVAGKTPTLVSAPAPPPDKEKVVPAAGAGGVIKYQVKSGDRLYTIAAQYNTTVDAIVARNNLSDPNVIVPGQTLEILQGDKTSKPASNGAPTPTPRPMNQPVTKPGSSAAPPAIDQNKGGKWIDVNISTQTLTAYEGNKAVFSTLVSTGVSWHPTVVGTYKIYAKYLADDMSGGEGAEYYYLPAVPYTMYFYGGYAIHGTYWHHNFGHPMSHGCVNLPTDAAKWVYNWAPMGTTVVTHW